jgi:hypothetical protein
MPAAPATTGVSTRPIAPPAPIHYGILDADAVRAANG